MIGQKSGDHYIVSINQDNLKSLKKIQECEPLEGIISSDKIENISKYFIKQKPFTQIVNDWQSTCNFHFPYEDLNNDKQTDPKLDSKFYEATEEFIISSRKLDFGGENKKCKIKGFVDLKKCLSWINQISEEGWVLIYLWDFRDIMGSFSGQKGNLQGFGGGTECILIGKLLKRGIRVHSIEFLDE